MSAAKLARSMFSCLAYLEAWARSRRNEMETGGLRARWAIMVALWAISHSRSCWREGLEIPEKSVSPGKRGERRKIIFNPRVGVRTGGGFNVR